MQIKLSVVIITFNEEKNIARCLDSVLSIADEIVVIDSYSKDKTKEICKKYKVKFIENKFNGHIEQKNFAITQANYPYILSLDADECLNKESVADILTVKNNWTHDGYFFNRLNNYCGYWVKHGGWYPDKKLRLWDSRLGSWQGENPHDEFRMEKGNSIKYFKSNILHFTIENKNQHIQQIEKFSSISAMSMYKRGKKSNLLYANFTLLRKFISDYFIKLGFLDGKIGFQIASLSAWSRYLRHKKLIELLKKA